MIKNYFKIAWRNLWKNKTFSVINIAGLSIGVCCFLLIALYVLDEISYDRYNTNADRIYRIDEQIKFGDFLYNGAETPAVMGPTFTTEFQQVEQYVRIKKGNNFVIKKGGENFRIDRVVYADSTLFEVFTLPMIFGDPKTALKEPHSLVITESTAKKYFNSIDAIGKTLLINDKDNYKITGIIKDIPEQSHFNYDFFIPFSELEESRGTAWLTTNCLTYILLKPGASANVLTKQFNKAMNAYEGPQFKEELNMNQDEFEKAGNYTSCSLTPLTKIHLHSNKTDELGTNGSIQYIYIFSAIAIFILLIACVNFMNLSTARSSKRAKEVGVRKVLGSLRNNLITQFLSESFLISFFSFAIALGLTFFLLPWFNELAGKNISTTFLLKPFMLSRILLLTIIVGLLAGVYPAFFLSAFRPIEVLKGKLASGFKGCTLRNGLVVFQFSISIILVIATVVIYRQLNYIHNKNIGFNKEEVLVVQNAYALNKGAKVFRDELLQMHEIKAATITGYLPVAGARSDRAFVSTSTFDGKNFILMQQWPVDENYIPTLQIQLKSGRNFSNQFPTDSSAVVINESAAKLLGTDDPVNKKLYRVDDVSTGKLIAFTVIGVIKNFNFNSLHEQVAPLVLNLQEDNGSMALRINANNIPSLVSKINNKWKSMVPSQPFSFSFLNDEFGKQYDVERRTGSIAMVFSMLAILIACLGLFGLVTYAAEQRIKEIGIRKILGAAIPDLIALLSRDFLKLILIAVLIASPLAWWMMERWLHDFAYKINISWWIFAAASILVLMIALVTALFQTMKAALMNPVKSLKIE